MLSESVRAMLQADADAEALHAVRRQGLIDGVAVGLQAAADQAVELWKLREEGSGGPLDADVLADMAVTALHGAVDDASVKPAEFRRRLLLAAAITVVAAAALAQEIGIAGREAC